MKIKRQQRTGKSIAPKKCRRGVFEVWIGVFCFVYLVGLSSSVCPAVTSDVVRCSTGREFLAGEVKDVIVSSRGTIELGRAAEVLVEKFESGEPNAAEEVTEPWSVNCIVVNAGTIYIGTSPNGGIYKYSLGKLTRIYSARPETASDEVQSEKQEADADRAGDAGGPNDVNEPAKDVNAPSGQAGQTQRYLANEHIFAMAMDVSGRLIAGISGRQGRLCRFEAGQMKTIYEPNDARYIFAIEVADDGDIFLGTGPEGKLYRLNSFGAEPQLVYDSLDKNILSLAAGGDGFIYAGSDTRGLVYRIEPKSGTATVLYDSEQEEIAALLFADDADDGCLYAGGTSAGIVGMQQRFAVQRPAAGRPEPVLGGRSSAGKGDGTRKLQIANTKKKTDKTPSAPAPPPVEPSAPGKVSFVYRISKDGFVTKVFSETVVLFSLTEQEGRLLAGTGNDGRVFVIEPGLEEQAIVYDDQQASQITAVVAAGDDVYLGTANPAKLIKLKKVFAAEGTYTSDLIDASQPARWGKLQIDADIPKGCSVRMASRSGNVGDVNDPTFSDWTQPVELTGPAGLGCPLGRFCQYKLVLQSDDGSSSPLIREVAVAHIVPNLAPRVEEVTVGRIEAPDKRGMLKISYKSRDDNKDKLIYRIDFRKAGRTGWIELEDKVEKDDFEWDGRSVEDGRYEIRVTASDERSNSTETKLTGSRISEPVVVDNTGPVIKEHTLTKDNEQAVLKIKASDRLSAIGQLDYAVDSNAEWTGTIPDDLVYDTTEEDFTIVLEGLAAGEHIIAVRVKDDLGNTTYRTFEVN